MKAAIIGASSESIHTIKKAQELGVEIVALDGNPQAEGLALADKGLCVDISDEEATIEALKKEKPDFVLTVPIGRYLTTIGAVNDALKLKGISKKAAVLCTDKYEFHKIMHKNGLRSCECFLIQPYIDKSSFKEYDTIHYPVILKPRFGSGSRAIYFIGDKCELQNALQEIEKDKEDFVLEEVAPGQEYGVDGAVIDGRFHLILLRQKINTPLPRCQAVGYFSINPEQESALYEKVKCYLEKTVSVLGLNNCLFHADLMIEKEQIFTIELSARPSGHYLHNLFTPLATGVDEAEEYIKYVCNKPYDFDAKEVKNLLIHFWDLPEGMVKKVPGKEEVFISKNVQLLDYQCNICVGDKMEEVTSGHSIMGRGYFILQGSTKEEMLLAAENIKKELLIL